MRKTKIVCTLGPASADEKVMEAMLRAGMNVARFNFSHGTHESHREMMQRFRAVRDRLGVAAAVMLDTKGPEIRLKDMAGGEAMLADGAEFTLTARDVQGDAAQVSITYAELPREVKAGDRILIDDGRVSLRVQETTDTDIRCLVEHGGRIATHKGVNVPGVHLKPPCALQMHRAWHLPMPTGRAIRCWKRRLRAVTTRGCWQRKAKSAFDGVT